MIVFDLQCENGQHKFEGWFKSQHDYEAQLARSMIACPICGDPSVKKAVMAPNIGLKSNQKAAVNIGAAKNSLAADAGMAKAAVSQDIASNWTENEKTNQGSGQAVNAPDLGKVEQLLTVLQQPEYKDFISKISEAQNKLLAKSEWVGDKFCDEARAIYYGDKEHRPIYGKAAEKDVAELVDEGIDVAPLLYPVIPDNIKN
ncbi:hypothetical protein LPB140_08915 [Sphingorhabdus lutea]|uniref:DUF1178 family protein n=1 Tax=Sphingorhabdus lutea TaxID=1913578 RepID=A0A1L3JCR7_9SPHN|nr:DUF1178 family protein [Sphingorhabdus lutea]APG62889.1 hypothetical protein LPB140_08915 [Sphingorhabdus lutea]